MWHQRRSIITTHTLTTIVVTGIAHTSMDNTANKVYTRADDLLQHWMRQLPSWFGESFWTSPAVHQVMRRCAEQGVDERTMLLGVTQVLLKHNKTLLYQAIKDAGNASHGFTVSPEDWNNIHGARPETAVLMKEMEAIAALNANKKDTNG